MISPESIRPELGCHAMAGAISKRRLSSVTRTVILPDPGWVGFTEGRVPSASVAALAASPAAENLRKSRLVRCADIFASYYLSRCELESHTCQITCVGH